MNGLCGYTVVDRDGIEEPCNRPATGWRWYQDCEHEDLLDVACDFHVNEGGWRIAKAEATVRRVTVLTDVVRELQDADPDTHDRSVSWLALLEALDPDFPA